MIRSFVLATAIGLFSVGPLQASVQVRFVEGAPKDRFILENVGMCDVKSATLSIDLSPSAGRLIFDVTGSGAGVEVYQPLELVEGANSLFKFPSVADGQDYIDLEIDPLASGDNITFTVDVDDTIGQREITVSGSEIKGAIVSYVSDTGDGTAVFTSDALANLAISDC